MNLPDVNVLLAGFRPDHTHHRAARGWLMQARAGAEPLGLTVITLSSVVRLATNPRVFSRPDTSAAVIEYLDALLDEPGTLVRESDDHWQRFAALCRDLQLRGNLVPDAHLAVIAMSRGAQLVTFDRGFGRYPRLRWRSLLDG